MLAALQGTIQHQSTRETVRIAIVVVVALGSLVLAILDHFTDSPIMRKRVNEGSDEFLEEHNTILRSAAISMQTALDFMNNPAGRE